jgi:hypothetical protein
MGRHVASARLGCKRPPTDAASWFVRQSGDAFLLVGSRHKRPSGVTAGWPFCLPGKPLHPRLFQLNQFLGTLSGLIS